MLGILAENGSCVGFGRGGGNGALLGWQIFQASCTRVKYNCSPKHLDSGCSLETHKLWHTTRSAHQCNWCVVEVWVELHLTHWHGQTQRLFQCLRVHTP